MNPTVATSHPTEAELKVLLSGGLPDAEAGGIIAHLDGCLDCLAVAERLTEIPRDLWSTTVIATEAPPPAGIGSTPPPDVPGYRDLREIGRGGCGVVYRATETASGRQVALKVLRAGVMASPEERARFQSEAKAVANLRHPNIVTVLAVGGPGEIPYYAMEHLPIGSLASRMAGTPLSPSEAASLIRSVASAVRVAHEAGIIHRDLKPGNILLDSPPGGVGPLVPKVADFGIAKSLDATRSTTPSLAILGTPSYMAPEQAFGKSRDVGPGTDIYAMGAILYELLIGHPPFRGATPYETLLLVRDELPVPPRRLRPGLPVDLETICLKCLEKEPAGRYPTVADLEADLQAFLGGRPVAARPVGWTGRFARWCRREPAIASLAVLSVALLVAMLLGATVLWRRAEARSLMAREALDLFTRAVDLVVRNPNLITQEELAALATAVEAYGHLLEDIAGDPEEESGVAYAMLQLTKGFQAVGDFETAEPINAQAVEILRRVSLENPDRPHYAYTHAEGLTQLGGILEDLGRPDEGMAARLEAINVSEGLVRRYPKVDAYRGDLASFRANLSNRLYHSGGDLDEAERLARLSLEENRLLVSRHPNDPSRFMYFDGASVMVSEILADRGDADGYLELMEERLRLAEESLSRTNGRKIVRQLLRRETMVDTFVRAGRHDEAERACRLALECWREAATSQPPEGAAVTFYHHWLVADAYRLRPVDESAARRRFREAEAIVESANPRGNPEIGCLVRLLATCPDPEIRDPVRALELADELRGDHPSYLSLTGVALVELGRSAEALPLLEAAAAQEPIHHHPVHVYLPMALWDVGEHDRARALLDRIADTLDDDPRSRSESLAVLERARHLMAGPPSGRATAAERP